MSLLNQDFEDIKKVVESQRKKPDAEVIYNRLTNNSFNWPIRKLDEDKDKKIAEKDNEIFQLIAEIKMLKNTIKQLETEKKVLLISTEIKDSVAEIKKVEKKSNIETVEDDHFKRFGLLEID